uniref:Uncharacterized protein n=1 Tax=Lotharella globosa TaxID=91324 RepID=A0A7S4E0T1_9EUKA
MVKDPNAGSTESNLKALELLSKAAELGHPRGQRDLGVWHEVIKKDAKQAIRWYSKAAEQGDAEAMFYLALCYGNGRGAPQDDKKAVSWHRKAADQGHVRAQFNVGIHYENGFGVEKDIKQAAKWYRRAADEGHLIARNALETLHEANAELGDSVDFLIDDATTPRPQRTDQAPPARRRGWLPSIFGCG